MPVYAADVLPDTTGRNLGSPSQRWNIFANNVDTGGASGVVYVLTSPVTASANSTGWQTLASCQIPAGQLNRQGKILRATLAGDYLTQAGQTPTPQLQMQVGFALAQVFFGITDGLPAPAGGGWRAQLEFSVYNPGSSGQIMPSGALTINHNPLVTDVGEVVLVSYSPLSGVDLTIAQGLTCHCLFTTNTSPGNVCTQYQFIVEVLN